MSGAGTGRGRGWLNLSNKTDTVKPGPTPTEQAQACVRSNSPNPTEMSIIPLILKLDQDDDGISFNIKLECILRTWKQECCTAKELENSFQIIYTKCKEDENLASKLVLMISSRTFCTECIHDVKIRSLLIAHMQHDFDNATELQAANPEAFRLAIKLLGEFYHKARLKNGGVIRFFAIPLLRYFDMLLTSAQPEDLKMFTLQLSMNGASIKSEAPEKLQQILIKVRRLLLTNADLPEESKVWLLLAVDTDSHRFSILPPDLSAFYLFRLGEKEMGNFQGSHCALSIQTSMTNKKFDGYESNVNVLQVTPPDSTSPVEPTSSTGNQYVEHPEPAYNNDFNYQNPIADTWDQPPKEKIGRPILGAGARLNKNNAKEKVQCGNQGFEAGARIHSNNLNDKVLSASQGIDKKTGWDNKYKSTNCAGWSDNSDRRDKNWDNNKKTGRSKGWEHDDRFETDYS